jgi:adenylate kinase
MNSILITGVSGSGKTTLGRQAAARLGLACHDYADLMLKAAPELASKDAIEALGAIEREAVYDKVTKQLPSWFGPSSSDQATILFENHLSVVQDGHVITFQTTAYRRYSARGLAVISADPAVIHDRRASDPRRSRSLGTIDQIAWQQSVNQSQAAIVSDYLEIPLAIIRNDDLEQAAGELTRWAGGLLA